MYMRVRMTVSLRSVGLFVEMTMYLRACGLCFADVLVGVKVWQVRAEPPPGQSAGGDPVTVRL